MIWRAYQRSISAAIWITEQFIGVWSFRTVIVQVALVIVIVITKHGISSHIASIGVIWVVIIWGVFLFHFIMNIIPSFVTWINLLFLKWIVLFLFPWVMMVPVTRTVYHITTVFITSISTGRQPHILGVILENLLILFQSVKMGFLVMNSWWWYKLFTFSS